MFVVDAEGNRGRVQEQPRLLLIHLLPQPLHTALTLGCLLNTQNQRCGILFTLRSETEVIN